VAEGLLSRDRQPGEIQTQKVSNSCWLTITTVVAVLVLHLRADDVPEGVAAPTADRSASERNRAARGLRTLVFKK
jgi:hypothetical protein